MKKVATAIALMIAMATGGIVSYGTNSGPLETKDAGQMEAVAAVQADAMTFSKWVSGCVQTAVHHHDLCGIDGCTQAGEHSHGVCSVAGCTETGVHMHNGEYCYPHSADDGHAYHDCGVAGCTEVGSHTHNTCGVAGCTLTGEHSHGNGGCHRQSGHGCHH